MNKRFEYLSYIDNERLVKLENRAAELKRQSGRLSPQYAAAVDRTGEYPDAGRELRGAQEPDGARRSRSVPRPSSRPGASGRARTGVRSGAGVRSAAGAYEAADWYWATDDYDGDAGAAEAAGPDEPDEPYEPDEADEPDERRQALITRGRSRAKPTGAARWLGHWRAIAICAAAVATGVTVLTVISAAGSAAWPASVTQVQNEITVACQNPDVAAEPSQVNFACAKGTRQILWVFSLLTSDDNPGYSDAQTGRKGLEPITPSQGGDIAWSLNLHHPYNPASPTDSLEVAARAINNIIGGATLTSSTGAPVVQPGLESSPANCLQYTGSSALLTRQGFPAICAAAVTSPAGQAALVSDVFKQWMVGAPAQIAAQAGVLFENADNPGSPQVQSILNSLPD